MLTEVLGARLINNSAPRTVISFHDECSAHTNEKDSRSWSLNGAGGVLKEKSRGPSRMVAAYCCADIGMWPDSMCFIEPGAAAGKDDWWTGFHTQQQAARHLVEFDLKFPGCCCLDVYDNSTGHNSKAADALDTAVINITPGAKKPYIMRAGYYLREGASDVTPQPVHFIAGDILHIEVKKGSQLSIAGKEWKALVSHLPGELINTDNELVGVAKGARQILYERRIDFEKYKCLKKSMREDASKIRTQSKDAWDSDKSNYVLLLALLDLPTPAEVCETASNFACNCVYCVLSSQPDFTNQKSGLEEVYMRHNTMYGTNHKCIYLPKFHPELNPIERVWSKMKRHVRRANNGSLTALRSGMTEGLSVNNLPLATIRRYCRVVNAYYVAYLRGDDIVTAQSWLKRHRTHRNFAPAMDVQLDQIYFPLGRTIESDHQEVSIDIGTDELTELVELLDDSFRF